MYTLWLILNNYTDASPEMYCPYLNSNLISVVSCVDIEFTIILLVL